MKFISWNVNGLKNCVNNGEFEKTFKELDADFFSVQEIKCNKKIEIKEFEKYLQFWNFSEKKGYSGTAIFSRKKPVNVFYGIKDKYGQDLDKEGRIITLEYSDFYLINCYFPNSKMKRERLNYRLKFNEFFIDYIEKLNFKKNVIICGDFNVASEDIDVCKDYRNNTSRNIGFSDEEKTSFKDLLNLGLIDAFRYFHPQQQKYSWWFSDTDRGDDIGWRLDYFLISKELRKNIRKVGILDNIYGSDHCPIILEFKLEE